MIHQQKRNSMLVIGIFGKYLGQTVPTLCVAMQLRKHLWRRWQVQHRKMYIPVCRFKMEQCATLQSDGINTWLLSPLFGVELIWNTSCFSATMIGRQCRHSLLVQPPWLVGIIIFVVSLICMVVGFTRISSPFSGNHLFSMGEFFICSGPEFHVLLGKHILLIRILLVVGETWST